MDLLFPMGTNTTARNERYHYPHTFKSTSARTQIYKQIEKKANINRNIYPAKRHTQPQPIIRG